MDLNVIYEIECLDTVGSYKDIISRLSDKLIGLTIFIDQSFIYSTNSTLNDEIIERYKGVNDFILSFLDIDDTSCINELDNSDVSKLSLSWINVGAALESSLQLFLISYREDYYNNPFSKWDNFENEIVKEKIKGTLNNLKENEVIDGHQKRSLKKKFDRIIDFKKTGYKIEDIHLYDLINFFVREIFSEDLVSGVSEDSSYQGELLNGINIAEKLDNIRKNRNLVHVFSDHNVNNWTSFGEHLKIYCLVLLFLIERIEYLKFEIEEIEYLSIQHNLS